MIFGADTQGTQGSGCRKTAWTSGSRKREALPAWDKVSSPLPKRLFKKEGAVRAGAADGMRNKRRWAWLEPLKEKETHSLQI